MSAGDVARAVVWVGGQVQGVGFRWWAAREASRQALPLILRDLAAQGYRFVTVSELLALGR